MNKIKELLQMATITGRGAEYGVLVTEIYICCGVIVSRIDEERSALHTLEQENLCWIRANVESLWFSDCTQLMGGLLQI